MCLATLYLDKPVQGHTLMQAIAAKGFDKQGFILTAVNVLCETDERRKTFQVIVEDAGPPSLQEARETPDVSSLLQDLYEIVDTAVTTDGNAVSATINQNAPR